MPPLLPVLPGTPERRSHDYQRHGTPSGFAALNLPMGEIVGGLPRRRHTQEFNEPDRRRGAGGLYGASGVGQRCDPQGAPDSAQLAKHRRFALHCTPTRASWLNLVERWFAEDHQDGAAVGPSARGGPGGGIRAWIAAWNARRPNPRGPGNLLQAHDGLRTIAPPAARESPPSQDWRSTRWRQVEAGVPYALGDRRFSVQALLMAHSCPLRARGPAGARASPPVRLRDVKDVTTMVPGQTWGSPLGAGVTAMVRSHGANGLLSFRP